MEKTGEQLKAEGIAAVSDKDPTWVEQVVEFIGQLAHAKGLITSCDVRDYVQRTALGPPPHPSAWGAAFNIAAKRDLIKPTGKYQKSRYPRSHSAIVAIWAFSSLP
jgi:hypothetical protein